MVDGAGVLKVMEADFGYWAPELRELHVHLPLEALPGGGEDKFRPLAVLVDGKKPRYVFWYVDATAYAYQWVEPASRRKLELFIPLPWRPGDEHEIALSYTYDGRDQEQTVAVRPPAQGGVWEASDGGNYALMVREMAGIARQNEPVEFDVTVECDMFPDPSRAVRATVMSAPGEFREIPCQVCDAERSAPKGTYTSIPLVRFRTAVQLSLGAREEALVHLWHCPRARAQSQDGVRLEGGAMGGTVENELYRIKLESKSGQLLAWHDKGTGVDFRYEADADNPGSRAAMNYTPDIYAIGVNWSHSDDWRGPEASELIGPVFCETTRRGPMHQVPQVQTRVTYRFYAGRREVRMSSVMRLLEDINVLGLRNCGMIQSRRLHTHAAWPLQDGTVVRLSAEECLGNDTGAPPRARMPLDTPWLAFYHRDRGYGLALICTNAAYFNEGAHHPNLSGAHRYVSLYNDRFLYTVRSMIFTYCSGIRSYHTPMHAGTVAYEEVAMLPFTFEREDEEQFSQVKALQREMLNPLVVVP